MSDTPEPNDAAHCSAVPLRWRVRWFIRGMGSILVPITIEELRREMDQCVDEQMKKWREENPAPPVQYTGHVPCRKCGKTHWMYGPCPSEPNA
jgi:hypothetical protein